MSCYSSAPCRPAGVVAGHAAAAVLAYSACRVAAPAQQITRREQNSARACCAVYVNSKYQGRTMQHAMLLWGQQGYLQKVCCSLDVSMQTAAVLCSPCSQKQAASNWKQVACKRQGVRPKYCCVLCVQVHVVNLRDAAAEGSKGLLHPLLKRYHVSSVTAAQIHSCDGWSLRCRLARAMLCNCLSSMLVCCGSD
jgi:hypothetical protein